MGQTDEKGLPWSPDGTKIAFVSFRDGFSAVYVMNADGTGQTQLTNNPAGDGGPNWSPDGTKIAFTRVIGGNGQIFVMNPDGTGQTNISNSSSHEDGPAWAPDGTKIVFRSNRDGNSNIYVMNADGTGQTRVTTNFAEDARPDWGPVPDTDKDGVPNGADVCPLTQAGAVVDVTGCSIAQYCPCSAAWKNRGAYVSCVAHAAQSFLMQGLITSAEKDATVSAAAQSSCGKK